MPNAAPAVSPGRYLGLEGSITVGLIRAVSRLPLNLGCA